MRPAAIEAMVNRCYRKVLEANDFGVRFDWWLRMHRWIRRRPAKGRR